MAPEITAVCASGPIPLADYVTSIGDERKVIDMLVGDLQRIIIYPTPAWWARLVGLGYDPSRDIAVSVGPQWCRPACTARHHRPPTSGLDLPALRGASGCWAAGITAPT